MISCVVVFDGWVTRRQRHTRGVARILRKI